MCEMSFLFNYISTTECVATDLVQPKMKESSVEEPFLIEASAVSFQISELPDDKETLHDDVHIVSEGKKNGDKRSHVYVHDVQKGKASLLEESKSRHPTCEAEGLGIGLRLIAGFVNKNLRDESADLKRHVDPESETRKLELESTIKKKRKTTTTHPPSAQRDPISKDGHQTKKQAGRSKVSTCEHGRCKTECKDCGGGSICEHGRIKSKCKDCGGGPFCEHGRIKSLCKECGGGSICEHSRRKSECKECGGGSICEHGRIKSQCKDCGGGSICEHGRQ